MHSHSHRKDFFSVKGEREVHGGKYVLFIRWENLHVCVIMKICDIGNKVEKCRSYS